MHLPLAAAFKLILALLVDGKTEDCVQGGALSVGLVSLYCF